MGNIYNLLTKTLLLSTAIIAASCGDEYGDGEEPVPSVYRVFDNYAPNRVDDLIICERPDGSGQIDKIHNRQVEAIFDYGIFRNYEDYPVRMTYRDFEENFGSYYYMKINDSGFATHIVQQPLNSIKTQSWSLAYDNDGHLVSFKHDDSGETYTITYADGNIVSVSHIDGSETSRITVSYTDAVHKSPIPNPGCIMMFDDCFGIDMDEIGITYYAALLGRATKNLPLGYVEKDGDGNTYSNTFNWTIDDSGYPSAFFDSESPDEPITFTWVRSSTRP